MPLPVSDIDMTPVEREGRPVRGEDLATLQKVASGDSDAQYALAQRLVSRVRRGASAFMPASLDAEDAAHHALIEVIRAAQSYLGHESVEAWADELVSRSLVRFQRAVRRRGQPASVRSLDEAIGDAPEASDAAAGLEGVDALLARLSDVRREALVLHHVYGYALERIADVAQCPSAVARERLLLSRQDLRSFSLESQADSEGHAAALELWASLRDREALGETPSDEERDECAALERDDLAVRASAEHLHTLENLLDRATLLQLSQEDRTLAERVLRAVRVSTTGKRTARDEADAALDHSVDPEGPFWLRGGAMLITTVLSIGVIVALLMYEPKPRQVAAKAEATRPVAQPAPQVVSLVHARTSVRGNQPSRDGELLAPETVLREGDVLRTAGNPACVVIDPDAELCLNKLAELKLLSLSLATRSVELVSGHVVIKRSPLPEQPLLIEAGGVRAVANGSVFGVEREADGDVRVRVLEGEALVRGNDWSSKVSTGQLGIYRAATGTFLVEPLPHGQMTREWELHATGQRGAGSGVENGVRSANDVAEAEKLTAEGQKTVDELMMEGAEHARAERWVEAVDAYEAVLRQHRGTPEAHIVLVRLGELRLEHRNEPERALVSFERYLQEGAGPLEAEALYGAISALLRLGRTEAARERAEQFLAKFPKAPHSVLLRSVIEPEESE